MQATWFAESRDALRNQELFMYMPINSKYSVPQIPSCFGTFYVKYLDAYRVEGEFAVVIGEVVEIEENFHELPLLLYNDHLCTFQK